MPSNARNTRSCDVLVIGSGAGGFAAAITAKLSGLDVIIAEKADCYGGTTAVSGGYLWIPCNSLAREAGISDNRDDALSYIEHEAGNYFDRDRAVAFVDNAAEMVDYVIRNTDVRFFLSPQFPDYHPSAPGALSGGRSMGTLAFDGKELGDKFAALRKPLPQITFFGMFLGSGLEIQHYFNVTRSLKSALFVAKSLARHIKDLALYGRGTRLTQGGALIARLARTGFNFGIPLLLSSPAKELIQKDDRIAGATLETPEGELRVEAKLGVVLATGGFARDAVMQKRTHGKLRFGKTLRTPVPLGITGDGIILAEQCGAHFLAEMSNPGAWVPVSVIPNREDPDAIFPHLTDRTKPGVLAVTSKGRRFVNEADSYHDFVGALIRACGDEDDIGAFMICDHRAINRYGLGFAKPFPVPRGHHIRSGYLMRGKTIAELAAKAGIDGTELEHTINKFNEGAQHGEDREFGRGNNYYNRYQGDPKHLPNPNVAPLGTPPFYAVKILPGEITTFAGLSTDGRARVLSCDGMPIVGLYAAGADLASVMGGSYPGAGANIGPAMTFGYIAARDIACQGRGTV
jgi:succinate dehydrogenase/fumarate reductase flavoprotein subunit